MRTPGIALAALAAIGFALAGSANAADLVLSTGLSRDVARREPSRLVSTLAIRGFAAPGFATEAAVQNEAGGVRTALSAWWRVQRAVYVGGGTDVLLPVRREGLLAEAGTRLGYHLGGGLVLPLTGGTGLDVSARYVFMDRRAADVAPDRFASHFWTLTAGVSFRM